jgi:hypothetical protein
MGSRCYHRSAPVKEPKDVKLRFYMCETLTIVETKPLCTIDLAVDEKEYRTEYGSLRLPLITSR